jgi:TonB family protein
LREKGGVDHERILFLIKGQMKKLILILLILTSSLKCFSQTDTTKVYFDENWKITSETNAKYFSKRYQVNDTLWQMNDHFIDGSIQMTGTYMDSGYKNKIGEFRYYSEDGFLKSSNYYFTKEKYLKETHYYKNGQVDYFQEKNIETGKLIFAKYFKENGDESSLIQPAFKGGIPEMYSFISNRIRYPKTARKRNIEGQVLVKFVIEKDGSLGDVSITKSANVLLNEEAKRVISIMPKWVPGNRDGVPIRTYYTIPIIFQLQ